MVEPVKEYLQQDLRCLDLLEYFHGLNDRDMNVFLLVHNLDGGLTVDEIAEQLDCERSTAYRSITRLIEADLLTQEQVNYEQGGYYHVYFPRESHDIADDMQRMLNDWYAKTGQLIQDFEDSYGGNQDEEVRMEFLYQSCRLP